MWDLIDGYNFNELIKEYHQIDFSKFSISIEHKSRNTFILYDNKIKVIYPHYIYNKNINGTIKQDLDIIGNEIYDYILNTLNRRISRFNITYDDIFILDDKTIYDISYTDEDIITFLNQSSNHLKFLLTNREKFKNYKCKDNVHIVHYNEDLNTKQRAKIIIDFYENKEHYNNKIF